MIGHCVFVHRVQPAAGRQNSSNIGQVSQQSGTLHNTKLVMCMMYLDDIPWQCRALEDGTLIRPGPLRRVMGPHVAGSRSEPTHSSFFVTRQSLGVRQKILQDSSSSTCCSLLGANADIGNRYAACRTCLMQTFGGSCGRAILFDDENEHVGIRLQHLRMGVGDGSSCFT